VKRPKSILVVIERTGEVSGPMGKALLLARPFGAKLELFLCDWEQAYVLGHAYDREGIRAAQAASVAEARGYLSGLGELDEAAGVEIAVDAECASPLYEAVVRKVLRSEPELVIKAIAATDAKKHGMPDPNDWQLLRTCPATLMLTGSRKWHHPPRFAAAVDVSEGETDEVARSVMEASVVLAEAFGAELHLVYGEGAPAVQSARVAKLRGLCDEAGIAPERMHVLSGQPERILPVFVRDQGYDALVLGALAHRAAGTNAPDRRATQGSCRTLPARFVTSE
jgi:universal stress protein E